MLHERPIAPLELVRIARETPDGTVHQVSPLGSVDAHCTRGDDGTAFKMTESPPQEAFT
jgi:hypothetical protein